MQADFATSAVDFLHRVGRTARAGQYGLVTSFYTHSNRDLVAAVRRAAELSQSVVIFRIMDSILFFFNHRDVIAVQLRFFLIVFVSVQQYATDMCLRFTIQRSTYAFT